jgi:hypothetical protein
MAHSRNSHIHKLAAAPRIQARRKRDQRLLPLPTSPARAHSPQRPYKDQAKLHILNSAYRGLLDQVDQGAAGAGVLLRAFLIHQTLWIMQWSCQIHSYIAWRQP